MIKEGTEKEFYYPSLAFKAALIKKTYSANQQFSCALTTKETDGEVTYSSSNTKVAKIDASTGKVTIVGAGSATIKAKSAATDKYAARSRQRSKNAATTSKTFTGLKKGKTYYVRIRAYRTDGGKKYYSAWSAVKSVKIKG